MPCSTCGSDRINAVRMPSYHTHHAALKCGQCDRFIAWMQKPETEGKRRDLAVRIDRLGKAPRLTHWERDFLQSLKNQKKVSPRQQEVLARIEAKVGGES